MQSHYDVISIGAGPIGMLAIWGLMRHNPSLRIKIFEKYPEPQRKHTLLMQHRQLKKIIHAAIPESERENFFHSNDAIAQLYQRLKTDARIRTNELQAILLNVLQQKVDIEYTKIDPDTLKDQLIAQYPNVKLIIGADGVKSTVNQTFFPPNNQYKQVFDYLLVLRYEVTGSVTSDFKHELTRYEHMSHLGIIASEIIGKTVDNKTPITLQLVISKENYEPLQSASFKEPITLKNLRSNTALPRGLETFVTNYLARLPWKQHIQSDSIQISAIEAPATAVHQVFISNESTHQVPVVLIGDASLGLSYFKGLNAGLESTAQLLAILSISSETKFENRSAIIANLRRYQTWFLEEFVPKKFKEVALFSSTRVKPLYYIIRSVQFLKSQSLYNEMHSENPFLQNYLNLKEQIPSLKTWQIKKYPHRSYDPITSEQFTFVPFEHTFKKITKLFTSYFTPYKSFFHFKHDIQQPIFGIGHLYTGILKMILGLIARDGLLFLDGLLTVIRGVLEIGMTPLSWTLKPIIRLIITVFSSPQLIEKNAGIRRTAKYGSDYLANDNLTEYVTDYEDFPPIDLYNLRSVANDLHRKYEKAYHRQQKTHIDMENENRLFSKTQEKNISKQDLEDYFSLFNSSNIPASAS